MFRKVLYGIAALVIAALVITEAGQFAPYEEPRIAAAVGAFDAQQGCVTTTAAGDIPCVKGQDVEVRLYRGLGGRFWGCGVDCIATSAARRCGVRVHVASHWGGDTIPASQRLIIAGASMGGEKAVEVATAEARKGRKVDLLLTIDPVPWTPAKPRNVVDHINWHNTVPGQLGGGTPPGTIKTANIAVDMWHVPLINSQLVHDRAVKEICTYVTGG
jgi:hypothetical protein